MADFTNLGLDAAKRLRSGALEYGATTAMNDFARRLSQQRGQRNLRDFDTVTSKSLSKLASAYSQRGLRNSGVRKSGVSDFATQSAQGRQDIMNQTRDETTQLDLEKVNAQAAYDTLLKELELDKTNSINSLFAQLSQYYPFLGS
jgi:hypothetical protein